MSSCPRFYVLRTPPSAAPAIFKSASDADPVLVRFFWRPRLPAVEVSDADGVNMQMANAINSARREMIKNLSTTNTLKIPIMVKTCTYNYFCETMAVCGGNYLLKCGCWHSLRRIITMIVCVFARLLKNVRTMTAFKNQNVAEKPVYFHRIVIRDFPFQASAAINPVKIVRAVIKQRHKSP